MIHFVVQATDQQINPAKLVCGFETGLMDALSTQFPNAIVLGCLFHLKQALRRAMKRYAIPEEKCIIAMTRGVLDMLTVIDPAQVEKSIKWVKRDNKLHCAQAGFSTLSRSGVNYGVTLIALGSSSALSTRGTCSL
ncbi:hypothetical protein Pcac1_g8383 [Phytophthora cactorum]|nr:hypothetical protein Pcac1_g8383 [Phytophthora cactorum]KAG2796877.1 hypothetical protein PC111_g21532 [Phytophthora cactorum]KAG2822102.1 hypothetical protein PC112_g11078 [Phytophthora cactorum]KAG2856515.1 hypothetical protein PC113_g11518 [Phytophthora cactorum]KAG2882490.1 hypothetical protein PC114_g21014 [Phytophthora cactorum]